MKFSVEEIKKLLPEKYRDLSLSSVAAFVNTRSMREKVMLLAGVGVLLFILDYWILMRPVQQVFNKTWPQLGQLQRDIEGLKTDTKNKSLLEKNWQLTKDTLSANEKGFIEAEGVPTLLENLSKLAMDSGVKLVSLQPIESKKNSKADALGPYAKVPIKISAQAGTHELGAFLAKLEGGETFFRVTNLTIKPNPNELRRHMVELDIDAYRKG